MPIADIDYREYFTPERVDELLQAFKKYDTEGTGALGEVQLHGMFKKLGKNLSRQQLREVLKEVDFNGSGVVEFEELCVLEIKMSRMRPRADLIDHRDYLDERTVQLLESHFVQQDPFGRGSIGLTELHRIIEIMGCKALQEEVEEIRAEVDKEDTGELEFGRLCAFWAVLTKQRKRINYREFLSAEQVATFRRMFEMFDTRGEQRISRSELDQLFRHLGLALKKQQLNTLLKDFDSDGSGDIDFEEFCVMMLRLKGLRRRRCINPETSSCRELYVQENFSIRELRQSGFGLEDFRKVGIPVGKIYAEGKVSALELRRAGYSAAELRRGGVGLNELRLCGFSLADLRNAGFSDLALVKANKALRYSLSAGDLSVLPQQRPAWRDGGAAGWGRAASSATGITPLPCPWQVPPRQMTPQIREHTDWRPRLSPGKQLLAVGAQVL
uniref:Troponin C, skeletal muscle n=1 Tax=Alexandrium andersonii TaxID=327968 RepID=A0A7S2GR34_9DINO|mmetsp:Transcript_59026/g.132846  ORF Transcript_59026/g.132846 Transcript_59026/m.132846 type:complete len:442 (+) Transcript_59026:112-1437(+)